MTAAMTPFSTAILAEKGILPI